MGRNKGSGAGAASRTASSRRQAGASLTHEQRAAVAAIRDWYYGGGDDISITLGGLAGTGKTTLAQQLPNRLGLRIDEIAYCAFTGKAASVLNERLASAEATTIHRLIYKVEEVHCQRCPRLRSEDARCHGRCSGCFLRSIKVPFLEGQPRLIVVDEASMVSESIYHDLTSFGVPIVWIGDHGQLPPVGSSFNLMADPDFKLERIHRQAKGSPILRLAMMARRTGSVPFGEHGPGVSKRPYDGEFDVPDDYLDDWLSDHLVLCGRNRTRVRANRAVRRVRGFPDGRPVPGDRVICLRNNWQAGIYNGMTGTLLACREAGRESYEVRIRLDNPDFEYAGLASREQFNSENTLSEVSRGMDLWDFGYCLTVHKAQGSEADRVILIEERLGPDPSQHRRWLYTGITRAKRSLEIIGPRKAAA